MKKLFLVHMVFVCILFLLGGCAGRKAFQKGEDLLRQGDYDTAVTHYFEAVKANPDRHEYRVQLQAARSKAARQHLDAGKILVEKEDYRAALAEFEQATALDPTNEIGRQESKKIVLKLRTLELIEQARQFYNERKFAQARNVLDEALLKDPGNPAALELQARVRGERRTVLDGFELDVTSDKPITLKFKDAEIRDVFSILSKLSGINFLFDEDVKAQKISIFLEEATFSQALELLLRLNAVDRKVLNAKTILIYPQKKESEKKYEDQVIQTFYLSNIDAKKAVNLLRTLLQLRKIYVHEELNALVVRDTPEVIKLAQQIIEAADRADSEVVFELELVEISHTDSLDVGLRLSEYSTKFGLAEAGAEAIGSITTSSLSKFEDILYSIPNATYSLQKKLSDSEILANPKIRVKNKEKAKVHIGSREPIITNTLTASGDVTSTNVQYVDVGVKLDVEPTIQLDNSVVTKLSLEVSSVSGRQKIGDGGQGGEALTISTTNAQTSLVLKDGEQTVIGGLIRDDFTKARDTIPFLGDIPFVGSLFSGHKKDKTKREIVLSITPHIVKNIDMPRPEVATIWSGGEDDLEAGARFGSFAKPLEPVATMTPPTVAPALLPIPAAGTTSEPSSAPAEEQAAPDTLPPSPTPVPLSPAAAPPVAAAVAPATAPFGQMASAVIPATDLTVAPVMLAAIAEPASPADSPVTPPVEPPVPEPPVPEPVPVPMLLEIPEPPPGQILLLAPEKAAAGEEFTVQVNVQAVRDLYSAPLFVSYDPQQLEFVRAREGEFLKAAGQSTIFTTSPDAGKGQLIVGYKQGIGGRGASGDGTLFQLVMRAKAAGAARIGIERLNFRTPSGTRLALSGADATIEVR